MTPTKRDPRVLNVVDTTKTSVETEPSKDQLLAKIAELQATIAEKMAGPVRTPGYRVGPKGGVSVYGINANFPITLYPGQWKRLQEYFGEINDFIESNKDLLEMPDDSPDTLKEKEHRRRDAGIVPRDPRTVRRELIMTANTERKLAS